MSLSFLILKYPLQEHAGQWMCQARNPSTGLLANRTVQVTVNRRPIILSESIQSIATENKVWKLIQDIHLCIYIQEKIILIIVKAYTTL